MHLLLSNDDGLFAEGLQFLRRELAETGEFRITTVAPDREQSATSHSLTLNDPLRIHEYEDRQYAVNGTPTDCVLVATRGILQEDPPDFVISGINHGPNIGEDVHYSGTVAAAFEGFVLGKPSLALSLASKATPRNFSAARRFLHENLVPWLRGPLHERALFNVNIPAVDAEQAQGVRFCRLGSRTYEDMIIRKEDPRGRAYYWIGGDAGRCEEVPDSDCVLIAQNWVTVTPLQADLTDENQLARHREWGTSWKA